MFLIIRCTYVNMPQLHVWHKDLKCWRPRFRLFDTVGRIHSVHPAAGDIYYLRILLHHDHCAGTL